MKERLVWGLAATLLLFGLGFVLVRHCSLQSSAAQLVRAKQSLEAGELAEARSAADAAVNWFVSPDDREQAWEILGLSHLRDRTEPRNAALATAMIYLSRVPVTSPRYPAICRELADQKMFEAKKPAEADQLVTTALRQHPRSPILRRWMIERLTTTGRAEMADPHFRAVFPDDSWVSVDLDEAHRELLQTWLWSQIDPERIEQKFDRDLGVAGPYDEPGDPIRLERWHTLITRQPDEAANYAAVAQWYLRRGQWNVAAEWLQNGKSAAEKYADPFYLSVAIRLLCETQQAAAALPLLVRLQALDFDFFTHRAKAWIAIAEGRVADAINHLEAARTVWPGPLHGPLSIELEQVYRRQGTEADLERAQQLRSDRERAALARPAILAAIDSAADHESRRRIWEWLRAQGAPFESIIEAD